MAVFLIVDDDPIQRKYMVKNINYELESQNSTFIAKAIHPLMSIDEYFQLIEDEKVSVIIVDEKLKNKPNDSGKFAPYFGHDLAALLRKRLKDIPIYTVTNYPDVQEIKNVFGDYDQVINRTKFYNSTDKYIPTMLRAAASFVNRFNQELSEFTVLSQSIAAGDTSSESIERLQALQSSIELPILGYDDRQSWLKEYEKQIEDLKKLQDELTEQLKK